MIISEVTIGVSYWETATTKCFLLETSMTNEFDVCT